MVYIPQKQLELMDRLVTGNKVIVIHGARRVGKTTLIKKYLEKIPEEQEKILFVNGDDIMVRQYLVSQSIHKLRDFVGKHTLLVVDEAQYVRHIGQNLKLIVDHIPGVKVIASGSSSFSLAKDIGEPLTGKKYTVTLYPLSQMEISQIENPHDTEAGSKYRSQVGLWQLSRDCNHD